MQDAATSQHQTNAMLKAASRERLWGNYGVTIGAWLVFLSINVIVLSFVTPAGDGIFSSVMLQVAQIIIRLLTGVFVSGSAYMYLNLTYGKKATLSDLFHGFKEEPNKAILIQVVYIVISLLCSVPLLIYEFTADDFHLGIYLAIYLLATALAFCLTLPFSQAYYLLQDFPERSVKELLRVSARLMRGNKLRLLLLVLSFLPLALLCIVTLFIPWLWLHSYYEASMAAFYKDLMEERGA